MRVAILVSSISVCHARESGHPVSNECLCLLGPRFRGDDSRKFHKLHCVLHYFFLLSTLCGLRLPMRPLSLPAAGSSTALMSVGLPESIAAFTARLSSSGLVALTPTPPKASIILSYRAPATNTVVAGSALVLLTSVPR